MGGEAERLPARFLFVYDFCVEFSKLFWKKGSHADWK